MITLQQNRHTDRGGPDARLDESVALSTAFNLECRCLIFIESDVSISFLSHLCFMRLNGSLFHSYLGVICIALIYRVFEHAKAAIKL